MALVGPRLIVNSSILHHVGRKHKKHPVGRDTQQAWKCLFTSTFWRWFLPSK